MNYEVVPLSKVVADENQPRKNFDAQDMARLIESIKEHGIRNPLIVEKFPDGNYLLEDGERRYRAAKALGLKEVPVIVSEPKDAVTRLITQFHLQEQHRGWTATEKAVATLALAKEMKMEPRAMAKLLAINERSIGQYMAFATLIEQKEFEKEELPIELAERIATTKRSIARAFLKEEENFGREEARVFERAVIERVKRGEINTKGDVSKFSDIAHTDLAAYRKLVKNDKSDTEEMFSSSSAKAFRAHKNLVYAIGHSMSYVNKCIATNANQYFTVAEANELEKAAKDLAAFAKSIKG